MFASSSHLSHHSSQLSPLIFIASLGEYLRSVLCIFYIDRICKPLKEMLSKAIFWNIGILRQGKVNVWKRIFAIYQEEEFRDAHWWNISHLLQLQSLFTWTNSHENEQKVSKISPKYLTILISDGLTGSSLNDKSRRPNIYCGYVSNMPTLYSTLGITLRQMNTIRGLR